MNNCVKKIGPRTRLVPQGVARAALQQAIPVGAPVGRYYRHVDETVVPPLEVRHMQHGQDQGPAGFGTVPESVNLPGGQAVLELLNPQFTVAEELYRKLPEESFYLPNVNSRNTVQFELGSFKVPDGTTLWLFDYEFSVYRPSGVDPGDFIKAAETRFSGNLGWDLTLDGRRLAHLLYELDPGAITLTRQAFAPRIGQGLDPGAFNRAAANSFAANASPGTSLLPVRNTVQGARNMPFTLIADEGTNVALSCVIFRQVMTPIAAVEGKWGGYLVQNQTANSLVNRLRPR